MEINKNPVDNQYIQSNQRKPFYAFDVNSTTHCNLRCTYCIEHDWFNKPEGKPSEDLKSNLIEKIDYMLDNEEFNERFGGIMLNFWGGEPTINPSFVINMVEHYGSNDRVKFFIYSNGFNISKVVPLLKKYKYMKTIDGNAKVFIQISYDGKASHDIARLDVQGKGSAEKVKKTLTMLRDEGIIYSIKQTIGYDDLDKMYENYLEFKEMEKQGYSINAYSPTIDYLSDYEFTPIEIAAIKNTLKEQTFKMMKTDIDYYRKNGRFFFGWMNPGRALCSAGENISLLDTNGDILVCHGAIYEDNREEHKLATIYDDKEQFTKDLLHISSQYRAARVDKELPKECQECTAHYCLKCNVKKSSNSKKEEYFDKWTDFTNQDHICATYKYLGLLRMAIMKKI